MRALFAAACSLVAEGFASFSKKKEAALYWFFELPIIEPIFRYITPNQLCYFRMFAAAFVMFFFLEEAYTLSFALFCVAAATDFIDGPLARWKDEVSDEGKNLDPMADKMLITIPLLLVGYKHFDYQTITFYLLTALLLVFTSNALKPYLRNKFSIPLTTGSNGFGQTKMLIESATLGILLYDPLNETILSVTEAMLWVAIGFGILSFLRHLARMDEKLEDPRKRIITIPNLITLAALFLCIPATFALMRSQFTLALWLLVGIFLSDWLDGKIARGFHQETHFGAALDPLRDYLVRFLLLFWFVLQLADTVILTLGLTAAAFEIVTAVINTSTARKYRTTSLVTLWGKVRGFTQVLCFAVLLLDLNQMILLSLPFKRLLFGAMAFASLIALLSYYGQRQRLSARA